MSTDLHRSNSICVRGVERLNCTALALGLPVPIVRYRALATHVVSRDGDITRDTDLTEHLRKRGIETLTVQRFLDLL